MKLKICMVSIITMGLWFLGWIWVQSDGEARKIVAEGMLEGISANIVNLDNHIAKTLEESVASKESDGVFLLSVLDSDFTLRVKEGGSETPIDKGAMYYPVETTRGDYYLRVDHRYFLENGGILNKYSRELTGYAIVKAPHGADINRTSLRDAMEVGEGNYLYYRQIKETADDSQLVLVAYIDKPMFYRLIYPSNVMGQVYCIAILLVLALFINSMLGYIGKGLEWLLGSKKEETA